MRMTSTLPDHGVVVESVLEGFVGAAEAIIASGAVPPFPEQTGVKYREEPAGSEEWLLPNQVLQRGQGDCEDLCIWTAAGLRVTGQDPGAYLQLAMTGPGKVHCVVMMSDGRVMDPSLLLKQREQAMRAQGYAVGDANIIVRDHRPGGNPELHINNDQWAKTHGFAGILDTALHGPKPSGLQEALVAGAAAAGRVGDNMFGANGDIKTIINRAASYYNDPFNTTGQRPPSEKVHSPLVQVQDPVTGNVYWQAQGAGPDPLAELPQTPYGPWGGAYGSDYGYGGSYGYQGGGYGYPQSPYGFTQQGAYSADPYQWDAPMMTYADLYGSQFLDPGMSGSLGQDPVGLEYVPVDDGVDPFDLESWL